MKTRNLILRLTVAVALGLLLASPVHTGVTTEQRQEVQELINRGNSWKEQIKNERKEAIKSRNGWSNTGDPGLKEDYEGHTEARRAYEESLKANRDSVVKRVDEIYDCGIPPGTDIGYDPLCGGKNDSNTLGYCSARCHIRICEPAFTSPDQVASTKIHEGKHAQQKLDGEWGIDDFPRNCSVRFHYHEWEAYNWELDADFGCVTKLSDLRKKQIADLKEYHREAANTAAWLEEMANATFEGTVIFEFPPDKTTKKSVIVTNIADEECEIAGHFEDEAGWNMYPTEFSFFLHSEQETTFELTVDIPPHAELGTANEVTVFTYEVSPGPGPFALAMPETLPQDFFFIHVVPNVEVTSGPDITGLPGSFVDFYFTVENRGSVRDSFDVYMTSVLGWALSADTWEVTLDPSESVDLLSSVEFPEGTPFTTDLILCEAVMRTDPANSDSSWLGAMIEAEAGVREGPDRHVFALLPNVPNPFARSTLIRFSIPSSAEVDLKIYDVRGRLVRTLVGPGTGLLDPGIHSVEWKGRDDRGRQVASGVYFYKLEAGGRTASRKLILLR